MCLANAQDQKANSIRGVADMSEDLQVGDRVRLIGIPDWLIHYLPEDEKQEISGFIGNVAVVEKIDDAGYFWLDFGNTVEVTDSAYYTGHTFCVTREYLEPA
jgi:hypothetical protein